MYTSFYGLSEKPFEITPDPKFLFVSPTHQRAFDTVLESVRERLPFVSITGEVGTGKTMLVRSILLRLDEKVKTAFILHPSKTLSGLIRNILQELDYQAVGEGKESLFGQLREFLEKRLGTGEILVTFIDEAQNVPAEVIEEMGRLQEKIPSIPGRLQIVFVGQPEFEEKLNSQFLRQINQRIKAKCKISPLTDKESKSYIEHRFQIAGGRASDVFTPEAMSTIVRHAQGIPRLINILCDNAFLAGYSLSRRKIDSDILNGVIKELEGPTQRKPTRLGNVKKLAKIGWVPFGLALNRKKMVLVAALFLCLGAASFLIYGSLRQKPINTITIESIKKDRVDLESAPKEALSQLEIAKDLNVFSSKKQNEPTFIEITVLKGETLFSLAQKYYRLVHPTAVDFILDFNPEITDANLIRVDQRIKLPKLIMKEWLLKPSPQGAWKIHLGTFWSPDADQLYRKQPAFRGKRIEVLPRKMSNNETWYRVVVGDFGTKQEGLKMIDFLMQKQLLPIFADASSVDIGQPKWKARPAAKKK